MFQIIRRLFGALFGSRAPKGFIKMYINVGQLSPYNAEAFCEKWRPKVDQIKKEYPWLRDFVTFVVPIRKGRTKIEICDPYGRQIPKQIIRVSQVSGEVFKAPNREKVKEYVLLMLGVPVVTVELGEEQLNLIYEDTLKLFNDLPAGYLNGLTWQGNEAFQEIALAKAKVILGQIRNYLNTPGTNLIEEGKEDYYYWMGFFRKL